jgi:hypothetical protein
MAATEATELMLYIENDANLHRQHVPILKNLATKKVRSQYKHDLAVKLFGYLVESGAKKYAKEFGSPGQPWHKMFDVPTRKLVAEDLTSGFEAEFELGNYDGLLPKKYQKEFAKQRLVPPHQHHARKKVTWRVPEGLEVSWSPVNQAYFALWPAKRRRSDQQVLKIASSKDMHDWLRSTYGESYGLASATRVPPSSWMSGATAGAAAPPARGSKKLSSKKSPTRLDREIANVVPSWRGGR